MDSDIIIVGGGASGLMAGIAAGRAGAPVLILEQKEKAGKKIYATGNGRCNFTNLVQNRSCYRGGDPDFGVRALQRFGCEDTVRLFRELGIRERESDGYLYPNSGQAKDIVSVLLLELKRLGAIIRCEERVTDIKRMGDKNGYFVRTEKGIFRAQAVILSAGGKASPKLGSDGSGYMLAKRLGHTVIPPVPALVQLKLQEKTREISGVRFFGSGSISLGENKLTEESGEFLFTDYGISGIPVLQMSRFAAVELAKGRTPVIRLNFLPDMRAEECLEEIEARFQGGTGKNAVQALTGLIHEKLIWYLFKACGIRDDDPAGRVSADKKRLLAKCLCDLEFTVIQTNSFENAQVTAGGIPACEVDGDMRSGKASGLYLTGELLDIDGTCGGYNLQWAWTSGWLAGCAAAADIAGRNSPASGQKHKERKQK